jgi:hypothetical protein
MMYAPSKLMRCRETYGIAKPNIGKRHCFEALCGFAGECSRQAASERIGA